MQATGPPRSDAGVGLGILRGLVVYGCFVHLVSARPPMLATGTPQSDAGVGIGILRGLGDSWKSLKFQKCFP